MTEDLSKTELMSLSTEEEMNRTEDLTQETLKNELEEKLSLLSSKLQGSNLSLHLKSNLTDNELLNQLRPQLNLHES